MMKMITPNTAAKSEAPAHFDPSLMREPHRLFVPHDACYLITPDHNVRCPQPTRAILDRLFFGVQRDSFFLARLTLDAILSAGNLVLEHPLGKYETKAL